MKRWLLVIIALTAPLTGQEISVPERPVDHVLDETGKVTAAERRAVQAEMELAAGKTGLGIYLVLLNSAAEEPPADVARRLAQAWRGSADRVVVLTSPDKIQPLVVEVSGESLSAVPEDQVRRMTEAALTAGQSGAPGLPAMLEAARSVIAQVEAFRKTGVLGPKPAIAPAVDSVAEPKSHLVAWIAGGSFLCCVLALILMRRGRQSAMIFPPAEFRRRFSAPHSGGNDAMVHFGK